ncbi:hypothetical protein BU15DRAFT_81344 [Melanogaster broomeanus]|nr:hypothetical protein BU15DRAFT_81344 [Melanogaster broomeanus]
MAISVDLDDGTMIRVPDLAVDGRNWMKYCKNLLRVAAEENFARQYDGTDMRPVDATNHELKAWQRRNVIAKQFISTTPLHPCIPATASGHASHRPDVVHFWANFHTGGHLGLELEGRVHICVGFVYVELGPWDDAVPTFICRLTPRPLVLGFPALFLLQHVLRHGTSTRANVTGDEANGSANNTHIKTETPAGSRKRKNLRLVQRAIISQVPIPLLQLLLRDLTSIRPALIAASRTYSSPSESPLRMGDTSKDMKPSRTVLRGDCAFAIISGSRPSNLSTLSPDRTSLRPCAAVREILPELMDQLVKLCSSEEYEQQETATQMTTELCRKFGDKMMGEMVPILQASVSSPDARTREGVCLMPSDIMENITDSQREGYQSEIVNMVWSWLVDETPRSGRRQRKPLTRFRSALGPKPLTKLYLRCWKSCVTLVKALVSFDGMSMSFDESFTSLSHTPLAPTHVISNVSFPTTFSTLSLPRTPSHRLRSQSQSTTMQGDVNSLFIIPSLPPLPIHESPKSSSRTGSIEELEAPDFRHNASTDLIRQRAAEKERNREASQHTKPGTIKHMQFTFSLDHLSPIAANVAVSKPDLKPSAAFKETITRRGRPTTRANVAGDEANGCTSNTHIETETSAGSRKRKNFGSSNEQPFLRFPSLFSSDFGPSALLYAQPSLSNTMKYGEDVTNTHNIDATEDNHLSLQQCQSDYKVLVDSDVVMQETSQSGTLHTDSQTPRNNYDADLATPPLSQSVNDALPQTVALTKISPSTGTRGNTLNGRPNLTS